MLQLREHCREVSKVWEPGSSRMPASLPARASELEGDARWPSWSAWPRKEAVQRSAALQTALRTCEQPYSPFHRLVPWTQMCTVAEIGSVYRRGWAGTGTGAETAFLVIAFLYLVSTAGGQLNPSTCLSSHIKCHCSDPHTQVLTD